MIGTTRDDLAIRNFRIAAGRGFSDSEVNRRTRVCLLGPAVVEELFGTADPRAPLGEQIHLKRQQFLVIGVLAPHGGSIEAFTSDIARGIAGEEYGLYLFEGLLRAGNFASLHLPSERFDEPGCLQMLADCDRVVSVHGCSVAGEAVFIGGRDRALGEAVAARLRAEGIGCSNYFPPIHMQPYMVERFGFKTGDFPVCEYVAARTIALPFFGKMNRAQIHRVCATLDKVLERSIMGRKGRL